MLLPPCCFRRSPGRLHLGHSVVQRSATGTLSSARCKGPRGLGGVLTYREYPRALPLPPLWRKPPRKLSSSYPNQTTPSSSASSSVNNTISHLSCLTLSATLLGLLLFVSLTVCLLTFHVTTSNNAINPRRPTLEARVESLSTSWVLRLSSSTCFCAKFWSSANLSSISHKRKGPQCSNLRPCDLKKD